MLQQATNQGSVVSCHYFLVFLYGSSFFVSKEVALYIFVLALKASQLGLYESFPADCFLVLCLFFVMFLEV